MSEPELVEDFFGVYVLICLNPRYKGRTYIGYTRDPNRRIKQHNRGSWAGGAHRTSNRGPWKMVMIIHGFPNNISALRVRTYLYFYIPNVIIACCLWRKDRKLIFEWAWQNPTKTIRLQHLNLRKIPRKETEFKFKLRVLSEMLRVGPWCRLPLLIRWLEKDYFEEFSDERKPPVHMVICHGPVKSKNLKNRGKDSTPTYTECLLCSRYITDPQKKLTCLNTICELVCHVTCLADIFLTPGEYIPIEGLCPFCSTKLKWGDLIRQMRGCKIGGEENDDGKCDNVNESCVDDDNDSDVAFADQNDQSCDSFDENSDGKCAEVDIDPKSDDSDDVVFFKEITDNECPSWMYDNA